MEYRMVFDALERLRALGLVEDLEREPRKRGRFSVSAGPS
jgi:hypothetical protein